MRVHTVDYRKDRNESGLFNRGFFIYGVPRLIPWCRLFGHKPVVDGVNYGGRPGTPEAGRRSRWASCDRCGIRLLQPVDDDLELGQRYTDPVPDVHDPTGEIGGQLVIGRTFSGAGIEVKVGNRGSEHTLAGHIQINRLGALYLHTEKHGTWLQRRLNPTGYESRVIGLSLHDGRLSWKLWAPRNHWSSSDPKWQQGSIPADPRDWWFGPKRYTYANHGDPVTAIVRMPHGDEHPVTLQLQRQRYGRARGRDPKLSWCVNWEALSGIPTRNEDRGRVFASAVAVTDAAATDGGWVEQACARIAASLTDDRIRYGFAYAHGEVA